MPITDEEKREIIWALAKDVTVSPEDAVMITGTLTGLSVCIGEEGGSPKRVIFRTASNSTLPFTLIAAGRESTVNGATAFLGMSHLNHCGRPLRASAGVLIR